MYVVCNYICVHVLFINTEDYIPSINKHCSQQDDREVKMVSVFDMIQQE